MVRFVLFSLIFVGTLFSACNSDQVKKIGASSIDKPHDPWVFRSVLDRVPRALTIALHDKLWLSYSTENAKLFKAWRGSVSFEGPVYDMAHGPQPTAVGDAYLKSPLDPAWAWIGPSGNVDFKVNFLGHKLKADQVSILYELVSTNNTIKISETPSAKELESGEMSFSRTFNVEGLKPNDKLVFKEEVSSIIMKEKVSSTGNLSFENIKIISSGEKEVEDVTAILEFEKDGSADLNISFYDASILDPNLKEEITEDAPSGVQLISKHGCRTCHNKNLKTIGPSYTAVAERYQNNDENLNALMAKIKSGGSGTWGNQKMNAHPEISSLDLKDMVKYILSLDADTEVEEEQKPILKIEPATVDVNNLIPGAMVKVYDVPSSTKLIPKNLKDQKPKMAGVLPNFDNLTGADFTELDENFAILSNGYLEIPKDGIYAMRIWSDDGSKVTINNKLVLDHDGPHGVSMKETELDLKKGFYQFKIEFYQGAGGKFLSWNYKPEGVDFWAVIPQKLISHDQSNHEDLMGLSLPMASGTAIPGDQCLLTEVHPAFDLYQARPDDFTPKVGGMDFMSDGSLIISTWDPEGAVYKLSNLNAADHNDIQVQKIASGLAEPLGVKIVDDQIFVMQKQEITQLIDEDNDGLIDYYKTLCDDWKVSANFHEFGFGLAHKDNHLYAALATAIEPGGASTQPQIQDRGKVIKVNTKSGKLDFIAHGLRTPNGVGIGYNGELFVSDNEGDWLPSSKINHIQEGVWFGGRSVDFEGTADLEMTHPLVWLPQNEVGNSPSLPSYLNLGPYKNQMIHGEVTNGGVKRVFVEEVAGKLQGCVFRFIQGLEAGINRLVWKGDDELYVGGIGNSGNWAQSGKLFFGLQRLKYNKKSVFEMLAVRAKTNGLEIEFTEALQEGQGWNPSDYEIKRWWYKPTVEYGGPKMDETKMDIKSATVSSDRKKVFLELDEMKDHHVYYVLLKNHFVSEESNSLWSTEAWYTMNAVPQNNRGVVEQNPIVIAPNSLTEKEKAEGWKLLFDGKTTDGWRNYKKETIGADWKVVDGTLHLNSTQNDDGSWSAKDGGDILTVDQYKDFELSLEWKITNCGNSGIMFNVQEGLEEGKDYCCPWWTGPEMQILDNACHPDTKFRTHRAGDLYDMLETKYKTFKGAGEWNKIRIVSKDKHVAFWMNGYKVVEFNILDENWTEMISKSKFKDMTGFGMYDHGHIALQDHSDKVWYRNIKIRKL